MNQNSPFRDKELSKSLISQVKQSATGEKYKIMEVCGTHTMAISRNGLRSVMPDNVMLVSGPGCPVCVTSQGEIDTFFQLLDRGVDVITFGDLIRIPSSTGMTLADARANGAGVHVIYSPLDSIKLAKNNPTKKFTFLGVGFETTVPIVAHLILEIEKQGIENLTVFSMCKTMPKAIELLLSDAELQIDGFLCPGHVTTVTGVALYEPIIEAKKAAVVAGFEPVEMLDAINEVINQVNSGEFKVENKYKRVVAEQGNEIARNLMYKVFEPCTSVWRGLGALEGSGLGIREEYAHYDALIKYAINVDTVEEIKGCKCGSVLTGKILPTDCALFKKVCTPETPVGPCMVSSEGTCSAYYKYI